VTYRTLAWRDQAACGQHLHFTDWHVCRQVSVCRDCPVTTECAQLGLESMPTVRDALNSGTVYGGLRPVELAALIRQRKHTSKVKDLPAAVALQPVAGRRSREGTR
jgi:hypothetical protein